MTTTADHQQAIANLGFVHERLPITHEGRGSWFVHSTEFNDDAQPTVRVTIDSDATTINVFNGYVFVWAAEFTPQTPWNVINQAVAAARMEVS